MWGGLFFGADDGTTGRELWKSAGTDAGTVVVKDIRPGPSSSFPDQATSLTDVGGALFFTASDGTTGFELWESDGTAAGTVQVKDIWPGPLGSFPFSLTDVGGTLFFSASDGTNGLELWKHETNEPPVANAGQDQNKVEWTSGGVSVNMDGSGSSDPDDDSITFTWTGPFSEGGGVVTGKSPTVTLTSLGTHTITLVVNDGTVDSAQDTVDITVVGVSNQQKWDTLGAERSGAGWRSGELPEGPVVASSPFGGLSLHLLPAL